MKPPPATRHHHHHSLLTTTHTTTSDEGGGHRDASTASVAFGDVIGCYRRRWSRVVLAAQIKAVGEIG